MVLPMWRQSKRKRPVKSDAATAAVDEEFGDSGSVGSDTGSRSSTVETRQRKGPLHHHDSNNDEEANRAESLVELDNLLESIAADGKVPNAPQRRRNHPAVEGSSRSNYSTAYGRTLYHGRSNGSVSKKPVPQKRRQNYKQGSSRDGGACDCLSDVPQAVQRLGVKFVLGLLFFSLLVVIRLSSDQSFDNRNNPKEALERFKARFKRRGDDASVSMEDLSLRDNPQEEDEPPENPADEGQDEEGEDGEEKQPQGLVQAAAIARATVVSQRDVAKPQTDTRGGSQVGVVRQEKKVDYHHEEIPQQQEFTGAKKIDEDIIPQHIRDSFGDTTERFRKPHDTPFFFHIPRSGGTVLSDIMTHCLDLVSASNIGITEGRGELQTLQVSKYKDQGKYVNVDTSSPAGIARARLLGLAKSGLADVITSHRFHEASYLFDSTYRGRAFGIFRNPVERAVSMFYYLQKATWEPTYDPDLATMTLEDYAVSPKAESNWLTRTLTMKFTGGLTEHHVNLSKEVLRRKVMIGLMDKFDESLKSFELYFGWWEDVVQKDFARVIECQESRKSDSSSRNEVSHPMPSKESTAYKLLAQRNWADMIVYDYASQLFRDQQNLVRSKR